MRLQRPSWSDVIRWALSGAAAVLSAVTLFFVHCEPARVAVFPAELIGLGYPDASQELRVIVPLLVSNEGARPAAVQSMALVIIDPTGAQPDKLLLKWDSFCAYTEEPSFLSLSDVDRAVAVNLPGNTSQSKYVAFKGGPEFARWVPGPRAYEMQLLTWTQEGLAPSIASTFRVTFTQEDCAVLAQFVKDRRGLFWWVSRDEWGRWNSKILSPAEYNQIRSKQ